MANKSSKLHRTTFAKATGIAAVMAAAVGASVAGQPPAGPIPDVALGWEPLLHLERGVALLLISGTGFLLLWRATQGRFPIRFGNFFEFEATEKRSTEEREALEGLQDQLDELRDFVVDALGPPVEDAHDEE